MIPIKLTLEGVFSYVEKQEIDFAELTDAGLFGIFGKVGSGKSSIVDAITYVLYNNNFRLLSSNMLRNMMNLSSARMGIEYDFRVGASIYRFSAMVNRKRNSDEPGQVRRGTYIWDAEVNDWVPTEKSAESIIGLSYDDFKRAVIIPQNNFQEFLELKNSERTEMMQKIFRLDKFDLSENIKHIKDINERALEKLEVQLQILDNPEPDKVMLMEQELKNLESDILTRQNLLEGQLSLSADLNKLKAQLDALEVKRRKLLAIKEKENSFRDKKNTLHAYLTAVSKVKPLFDRRAEWLKQQTELQSSIANTGLQQSAEMEKHARLVKRTGELKTAYENRDQLKLRADDLRSLLRIRQVQNEIKERTVRRSKGLKMSAELSEKIENEKTEKLGAQKQLTELNKVEIDIVTVSNVLNWYKTMEGHTAQIKLEELQLKKLRNDYDSVLLKKQSLNGGRLSEIQVNSPVDFIESQLISARRELETELKSVRELTQKISQQVLLQKHVQDLHQGEACPLCGSTEHPEPLNISAELQDSQVNLQKKEDDLNLQIKKLDEQKERWSDLKHEIIRQEEQISQCTNRLSQLTQVRELEKSKFEWPGYSPLNPSKAIDDRDNYQKQTEQKKKLTEKIDELSNRIDGHSAELIKYQSLLQQIDMEISNFSGTILALQQNINTPIEEYQEESAENLSVKAEQLMKAYNEVSSSYENARNELNNSVVVLAELKTRQEVEIRQCADLQANIKALSQDLERLIAENGFDSTEKVQLLLNSGIDEKLWQQDIENYFESLLQAQADFTAAFEEIGGKTYDETEHRVLKDNIVNLQNELDAKKKRSGVLELQIKSYKSNLELQKELLGKKAILDLRADNLQTLENLFKGKGFVNFASGVYLQNLVQNANERFRKMTHGQLLLQLDGSNSFEVLDILNEGKTRSVRTLSGGQKFQAALCLALALADGISQGTHENFFFMDEGFGALDKESMQVVFETLQSLRNENRVVGLISHVEEMQQEMSRYITVHRDEQKGSWIELN